MRLRLAVVLLAGLVAASGCARREDGAVTADDVRAAVEASSEAPRVLTIERDSEGRELVAHVAVQDDYRYEVAIWSDGAESYAEVVYDDARYVRIADVAAGQWVRHAAEPEFPAPGGQAAGASSAMSLEQVQILERLPSRLRGMRKWDPDSSTYLEAQDKFPRHEGEGVRFDVIPAAYDGDVVFRDGIPDDLRQTLERYFLYTSVWVDDGRVQRVELLFDIDVERVQADMARVRRLDAARTGLRVDAADVPPAPAPYRERDMFD